MSLRFEEDFGREESFVTDIDSSGLSVRVGDGVRLEPVVRLAIVTRKFLNNIRADVAVLLLDALGGRKRRVRLATLSEQRLNKLRDVAASDGHTLDRRANDVAFGDGDNVSDTGTRVDYGTSKGSVLDLRAGPRSSEGEHGLYSNVQTGDVERLKHDLGGGFTVLRGVQWLATCQWNFLRKSKGASYGLGEEEVVVLWLDSEVLEYRVGPKAFHEVLPRISIPRLPVSGSIHTQLSI